MFVGFLMFLFYFFCYQLTFFVMYQNLFPSLLSFFCSLERNDPLTRTVKSGDINYSANKNQKCGRRGGKSVSLIFPHIPPPFRVRSGLMRWMSIGGEFFWWSGRRWWREKPLQKSSLLFSPEKALFSFVSVASYFHALWRFWDSFWLLNLKNLPCWFRSLNCK